MNSSITGVFPVLPTIFDSEGAIDIDGFRKVIDYVLNSGADGIVFPGMASEVSELSADERLELTALVGAASVGRAAFVVGASAATPAEAASYARAGADAGAVCAMIMTPPSLGGDAARLGAFYSDAAASAGIPIMLQNAPPPAGSGLLVEVIRSVLIAAPDIRYVKEETLPCGPRIAALLDDRPDSLAGVFGGAGGRYILDELVRDAAGTMPACELTEAHVALVKAYRAGEIETARLLFERMLPILSMQAIYRWRLTKDVLRRRGLISSSHTRAAGPDLDEIDRVELAAWLERLSELTEMA